MTISPDLDIIDRAIQHQYCETGNIEDLDPGAFTPKDGEKALSFSDRNQKTPEKLLEELSANSDYFLRQSPEKQRDITVDFVVGLKATAVEQVPHITDVLLDDPDGNPAHVAVSWNTQLNGDALDDMARKLRDMAREEGIAAKRNSSV